MYRLNITPAFTITNQTSYTEYKRENNLIRKDTDTVLSVFALEDHFIYLFCLYEYVTELRRTEQNPDIL